MCLKYRLELFGFPGSVYGDLDLHWHTEERLIVIDIFLDSDPEQTAVKESWVLKLRHLDSVVFAPFLKS
jgi:hypothetical protein